MEECAAAALPSLPMASMSESPKAAVAAARLSWRGSPGSLSFPLALSTTGVWRVADLEVLNGINTFPAWLAWQLAWYVCTPVTRTTLPHTITNLLPHACIPHLRRVLCSPGCGCSGHRWLGIAGPQELWSHLLQLVPLVSGLEGALAWPPLG